jgi:uncharacterized protein (DUF488 family)
MVCPGCPIMATVFTFGHSTRTADEILELLRAHGIGWVIDVRRHPGSRRYPHVSREALMEWLHDAGIGYGHLPALGGRRSPVPDSRNGAWRNAGFRGYADYMSSDSFLAGLEALIASAQLRPTAAMCAEAVPWRCHRRLIADALVARGHEVRHILSIQRADRHALSEHAQVLDSDRVVYPGAGAGQTALFGSDT